MTTFTFTVLFVTTMVAVLIRGQWRYYKKNQKKKTFISKGETWYDPTYYHHYPLDK